MVPEYPYPGRGVSLEILRGEVVRVCGIKRPKFARKYKAKNAVFRGVGGSNQKALQGESMEV